MTKLLDLRFTIGLFFAAIGAFLLSYVILKKISEDLVQPVNLWSGVVFLIFGLGMIALARKTEN